MQISKSQERDQTGPRRTFLLPLWQVDVLIRNPSRSAAASVCRQKPAQAADLVNHYLVLPQLLV